MKSCLRIAALSLASLLSPSILLASGPAFNFATVSIPHAQQTNIYAINNAGIMVGQYIDSAGVYHGVEISGAGWTAIDHPVGSYTYCAGINSNNVIVGTYYQNTKRVNQAFIYQDGTFTDIGPSEAVSSFASGINDAGVVVGSYVDSSETGHGFMWDGTTYTTLDVPGAAGDYATGINNSGFITMFWFVSIENIQGALYHQGVYTTINVPGAVDSYAEGINTAGEIVFLWTDTAGKYHGSLRAAGQFYSFDDPNQVNGTFPSGINDHGVIVGAFENASYASQGFKAVP